MFFSDLQPKNQARSLIICEESDALRGFPCVTVHTRARGYKMGKTQQGRDGMPLRALSNQGCTARIAPFKPILFALDLQW